MNKKISLILAVAMVFLPLISTAQWSSDPMQNLGVAVSTGEQVVPKMVATSDSGCYISWFDSRSGGYAVYLQRLNAAGVAQWATNGLLISNHPQSTSLVDWDMTVDQSDNAVLVFTDIRNGGTNDLDVFAYKISPAGAFLWGLDGVGLSPTVNSDYEANPKVTATTSGSFVFAWIKATTPGTICFQRLSSTGQKMWGVNGITLSGATGHSLTAPDLAPADSDNVIVLWKNSTGSPLYPTTWLYTQKFDPNANPLWASDVLIYNGGHISAWTYPQIVSDNNGGAFYCWYDSPSLSSFNVSVGHVNSAGSLVFPLNGVPASTNSSQLHMSPYMTYVPGMNMLYCFWQEENVNQTLYGVYGQRFSPSGARMWSEYGHEFVPLGSSQISFVCSGPTDTTVYVGYFEAPNVTSNAVKAFKVTPAGTMPWGPTLLSSATLGNKDDLLLVVNRQKRAFLTWSDGRNDFADIYAQNVNPNGTLGNPSVPSLDVTLTPYDTLLIGPNGGYFRFHASAERVVGPQAPFVVWARIKNPNGTYTNPTLGPIAINPPIGVTVARNRTQNVPGTWSPGVYTYLGYANTTYRYPAIDSSWFSFTKTSTGSGPFVWDATCTGEPFPGEEAISPPVGGPSAFSLYPCSPNPFNPSTAISYQLSASSYISLRIYDNAGRLVVTLVDGMRQAGTHEVTFDGSKLASGVYLARLEAGNLTAVQKLVLMK